MQIAAIRSLVVATGLLASAVAAVHFTPPAAGQTGPGWTQMFDGKTLGDWDRFRESNWRVEDGAIVAAFGMGLTSTWWTIAPVP